MALGISKITVTPMQRIIVDITPPEAAPLNYEMELVRESNSASIIEEFTGERFLSTGLYRPENYTLKLTAVYADTDDNITYEHPTLVSMDVPAPMAIILRQAIWDILAAAEIVIAGREVYMIHDGYWRPAVIRKSSVPDMPLPAIEIGMPKMRTTRFTSGQIKREEWRIPIRTLDAVNKDNPDELGPLWLLAESLQAAVDLMDNINLGGRGVLDKAWEWRVMEDPDQERDRMSGLRMWLTVYVERCIGAVGA